MYYLQRTSPLYPRNGTPFSLLQSALEHSHLLQGPPLPVPKLTHHPPLGLLLDHPVPKLAHHPPLCPLLNHPVPKLPHNPFSPHPYLYQNFLVMVTELFFSS